MKKAKVPSAKNVKNAKTLVKTIPNLDGLKNGGRRSKQDYYTAFSAAIRQLEWCHNYEVFDTVPCDTTSFDVDDYWDYQEDEQVILRGHSTVFAVIIHDVLKELGCDHWSLWSCTVYNKQKEEDESHWFLCNGAKVVDPTYSQYFHRDEDVGYPTISGFSNINVFSVHNRLNKKRERDHVNEATEKRIEEFYERLFNNPIYTNHLMNLIILMYIYHK